MRTDPSALLPGPSGRGRQDVTEKLLAWRRGAQKQSMTDAIHLGGDERPQVGLTKREGVFLDRTSATWRLLSEDQARALRDELATRLPEGGRHVLAAARIACGRAEVLNTEGRPSEALHPLREAQASLVVPGAGEAGISVRLCQVALHRLEG